MMQLPNMAIKRPPNMAIKRPPNMAITRLPNMAIKRPPNMAITQQPNMAITRQPNMAITRLPTKPDGYQIWQSHATKYGNQMVTKSPYGNHIWLLYYMCCAVQNAKNKHGLPNWHSCDLLLCTCWHSCDLLLCTCWHSCDLLLCTCWHSCDLLLCLLICQRGLEKGDSSCDLYSHDRDSSKNQQLKSKTTGNVYMRNMCLGGLCLY